MNYMSLRKWLLRERKRAVKLSAFARSVGADTLVNTWDKEEIEQQTEPDRLVLAVLDDWVAQRRESTNFLLQWFDDSGHPLTSCEYRLAPVEDAGDPPLSRNQVGADISTQQILAQFMRHDEQREKTLISALDTIFNAQNSTVQAQRKLIEELQRSNLALTVQLQTRADSSGDPEELAAQREAAIAEAQQRARAWEKLEQFGPPVLQALLSRFAGH